MTTFRPSTPPHGTRSGVWDRLLEAVSAAYDGDIVMIDSSCVRVHQHGAAIKKGATTIVAWDAPGRPDHEDPCLGRRRGATDPSPAYGRAGRRCAGGAGVAGHLPQGGILLADKAYDTDAIRAETAERGTFANVPARVIRKRTSLFSPWLYRQRNPIERFFNRIKQMRGLATRYDRRPDNFLAALKLAATRIWINA